MLVGLAPQASGLDLEEGKFGVGFWSELLQVTGGPRTAYALTTVGTAPPNEVLSDEGCVADLGQPSSHAAWRVGRSGDAVTT